MATIEEEDNDDDDDNNISISLSNEGLSKTLYKKEKKFNISKEFEFQISVMPMLSLVFNIVPSFSFEVGLELTMEMKDDISLIMDAWGKVEVGIKLEAGLTFPAIEKHLRKLGIPTITVSFGIEGQLISIKVGLKLSLIISKIEFEIDVYSEIQAFSFSFYFKFKFEFEIEFLNIHFKFEFYIFKWEFNGISIEIHIKKTYKCLNN